MSKIKVLVATKDTQGQRKNDFFFTKENEIVIHSSECDCEAVDGKCGCKRSLAGIHTLKATTTMKVIEQEKEKVEVEFNKSAFMKEWSKIIKVELLKEVLNETLDVANHFPVGAVIERRGSKFSTRRAI